MSLFTTLIIAAYLFLMDISLMIGLIGRREQDYMGCSLQYPAATGGYPNNHISLQLIFHPFLYMCVCKLVDISNLP